MPCLAQLQVCAKLSIFVNTQVASSFLAIENNAVTSIHANTDARRTISWWKITSNLAIIGSLCSHCSRKWLHTIYQALRLLLVPNANGTASFPKGVIIEGAGSWSSWLNMNRLLFDRAVTNSQRRSQRDSSHSNEEGGIQPASFKG